MDRFSIPQTVRTFLEVATETKVADATDLVALAINNGTDWQAIMSEVLVWAFNNRHSPSGMEAHSLLVAARDAATVELAALAPKTETFTLRPVR